MWRGVFFALTLVLLSPALLHATSCATPVPLACTSLSNPDEIVFVGTVISVDIQDRTSFGMTNRNRFRVEEVFSGIRRNETEADVYTNPGSCTCGLEFQTGKRYLVFANRATEGTLPTAVCSLVRPVEQASALLPQLRAKRDGYKVASLYGVLRREQKPYKSTEVEDYNQPQANIGIQVADGESTYKTRTDTDGIYSFYDLPRGKYRLTAETSESGLARSIIVVDRPWPSVEDFIDLQSNICDEQNVVALPSGSIQGHVLDSQGNPLSNARVVLFRAESFKEGQEGTLAVWEEWQRKNGFLFENIAEGDYILVFNYLNQPDPNAPFPRTFYPNAAEKSKAAIIHVSEGEHLQDANIHLNGGEPTRKILVRLIMEDGIRRPGTRITVEADRGVAPAPVPEGNDAYSIRVLRGVYYTIQADILYCNFMANVTKANGNKSQAIIDGDDEGISEVTLFVSTSGCSR